MVHGRRALLALFLAADLNVLQLGEESAQSLGLHLGRTRFLAILAAALLAGAAVSFAGLLGFVGLLVPHMVRRLVKRQPLAASGMCSAGRRFRPSVRCAGKGAVRAV